MAGWLRLGSGAMQSGLHCVQCVLRKAGLAVGLLMGWSWSVEI